MNRKSNFPAYCRYLELLGLPEHHNTQYGNREKGGISDGMAWNGYTIGWKIIRRIKQDMARFFRDCDPSEIYIKMKVKEFMVKLKITISRSEPFIIKVNLKPIQQPPKFLQHES